MGPVDAAPDRALRGGFGGSAEGWLPTVMVGQPAHATFNVAAGEGCCHPPSIPRKTSAPAAVAVGEFRPATGLAETFPGGQAPDVLPPTTAPRRSRPSVRG